MRTPIWMPDALSYQGDQEDVRPLRGETPPPGAFTHTVG
jgi:hypothetical protein